MTMQDKVAVVTGAAGGIGQAVTRRLLGEGCHVVMADLKADDTLAQTLRNETQAAGDCVALAADVGDAASVEALFGSVEKRFGRLDILVNNAGITLRGALDEVSLAEIQAVVSTNLMGPLLCSRAALPMLRAAGGSCIVNVASELAMIGVKGLQVYCATKGGVVSLTRAMAADHVDEGIRVNAVCPGPVLTPMIQSKIDAAADPEEAWSYFNASTIMGRVGQPEEIANAVWFVASSQASFMTGSTMVVDGGATAV